MLIMHVMHIENFSRCLTQSMSLAGNCYDNAFLENLCIESLRATLKHPRPQTANQIPRLTHLRQRKRSRRPSESERIVRCVHDARVSPVSANSRLKMASI